MPRRRRSASKSRRASAQASDVSGLSSGPMAVFCIDTATGQVATRRQLVEAGIATPDEPAVPRPWLAIQGPGDASTMWYAVMRKRERGVFSGALVLRHQGR